MTHLLLVEDDEVIREETGSFLARKGYDVVSAGTLREAEAALARRRFNIVVADLVLPDGALSSELCGRTGGAPLLIMTSYKRLKSTFEVRGDGVTYIDKPLDLEVLQTAIQRVLEEHQAPPERRKRAAARTPALDALVGDCAAMRKLRDELLRLATRQVAVLILGETGTGKELVARALHEGSGRRGRFIPFNCAELPETLIESELLGSERGAFTGANEARAGLVESADGGTLFLDEVGELSPRSQACLLRVLQEKKVRRVGGRTEKAIDVRFVAATHRDLRSMVKTAAFRDDLLARLGVELRAPPLRDRGDDIVTLAQLFINRICEREGQARPILSDEARLVIRAYRWPKNVRELVCALERALAFTDGGMIEAAALGLDEFAPDEGPPSSKPPVGGVTSINEHIRQVILRHQGKLTETELARLLGKSRKWLWEWRKDHNLPRPSS